MEVIPLSLLDKEDQNIMKYIIRPFLIYFILVFIIIIIGVMFDNISDDTMLAYVNCLLLYITTVGINIDLIKHRKKK